MEAETERYLYYTILYLLREETCFVLSKEPLSLADCAASMEEGKGVDVKGTCSATKIDEQVSKSGTDETCGGSPNNNCVTKKPPIPTSLNLALPILRVEQLKGEGIQSPITSDSDLSDTEIINRLGEFVPPSDELTEDIVKQVSTLFTDLIIIHSVQ